MDDTWHTTGFAHKRGNIRKNWKYRYFTLDHNGFWYFREPHKRVPLGGCELKQLFSVCDTVAHCRIPGWMLRITWEGRTFLMQLSSIQERDRWRIAISRAIRHCTPKISTRLQPNEISTLRQVPARRKRTTQPIFDSELETIRLTNTSSDRDSYNSQRGRVQFITPDRIIYEVPEGPKLRNYNSAVKKFIPNNYSTSPTITQIEQLFQKHLLDSWETVGAKLVRQSKTLLRFHPPLRSILFLSDYFQMKYQSDMNEIAFPSWLLTQQRYACPHCYYQQTEHVNNETSNSVYHVESKLEDSENSNSENANSFCYPEVDSIWQDFLERVIEELTANEHFVGIETEWHKFPWINIYCILTSPAVKDAIHSDNLCIILMELYHHLENIKLKGALIILHELSLPLYQKTIPPINTTTTTNNMSGHQQLSNNDVERTNSLRYQWNGILFTFVSVECDESHIQLEKLVSHEFNGSECLSTILDTQYFSSIYTPQTSLIDYMGYKLTAQLTHPTTALVYGTDCVTFTNVSPEIHQLTEWLGDTLHIKPHSTVVKDEQCVLLSVPYDVQITLANDGRYYINNVGRFCSPDRFWDSDVNNEGRIYLFRIEHLLHTSPQNPDAYTAKLSNASRKEDKLLLNNEHLVLIHTVIPSFVQLLPLFIIQSLHNRNRFPIFLFQMHRYGLNYRYLATVFNHVPDSEVTSKQVIMEEILARSLKNLTKTRLRKIPASDHAEISILFIQTIQQFIQTDTPANQTFWTTSFYPYLFSSFLIIDQDNRNQLTYEQSPDITDIYNMLSIDAPWRVLDFIDVYRFLFRFCQLMNIFIPHDIVSEILTSTTDLIHFDFNYLPKVKYLSSILRVQYSFWWKKLTQLLSLDHEDFSLDITTCLQYPDRFYSAIRDAFTTEDQFDSIRHLLLISERIFETDPFCSQQIIDTYELLSNLPFFESSLNYSSENEKCNHQQNVKYWNKKCCGFGMKLCKTYEYQLQSNFDALFANPDWSNLEICKRITELRNYSLIHVSPTSSVLCQLYLDLCTDLLNNDRNNSVRASLISPTSGLDAISYCKGFLFLCQHELDRLSDEENVSKPNDALTEMYISSYDLLFECFQIDLNQQQQQKIEEDNTEEIDFNDNVKIELYFLIEFVHYLEHLENKLNYLPLLVRTYCQLFFQLDKLDLSRGENNTLLLAHCYQLAKYYYLIAWEQDVSQAELIADLLTNCENQSSIALTVNNDESNTISNEELIPIILFSLLDIQNELQPHVKESIHHFIQLADEKLRINDSDIAVGAVKNHSDVRASFVNYENAFAALQLFQ